jgi:hypothetical protein
MTHLTDHDLEQLSAYLDGELGPSQMAEIEARLQADPVLQRTLAQLSWMTASLKSLPAHRAPRRYRLTPEMVGQRARTWRVPALRLATGAVAMALAAVIGLDFLGSAGGVSLASAPQAFQAPAVAQDSSRAAQSMTEKTEEETQPAVGAEAGAAAGTPFADSLRASGSPSGANSSLPLETPPVALAAPAMSATESAPRLTPSPAPAPLSQDAAQTAGGQISSRAGVLRWSEILLGAGLFLLLAVQIMNRR